MDGNSIIVNLSNIFQDVALNGVNDQNIEAITEVMALVVDSNDLTVFNSPLLHNLFYILENSNTSSIILQQLIAEIKLKSVRLIYTGKNKVLIMGEEEKTCIPNEATDLPKFTNLPQLPAPGSYARARHVVVEGDVERTFVYRIDHTGQAIELVETFTRSLSKADVTNLNDNVVDRVLREMESPGARHVSKANTALKPALTENDL